ncbi:MAG: putative ABC transporter permease [Lactimicrobium sp.]|uniref:putative ABC transporter permease n=1 Tax=Lactimicrobium sp. TaxID=2563780 RepID=UPI002F350EC3
MIADIPIFDLLRYFLIYSFLGWCLEVIWHAIVQHKIVNRGFLNGPVCPIYGFGMCGLLLLSNIISNTSVSNSRTPSIFVTFLSGMILCTLIELIAGWLLEKCFHARWWDYSKQPLNFHGYICLRFSLIWGILTVIIIRFIHPLMPHSDPVLIHPLWQWIIIAILYAIYLTDFIVTAATTRGFDKRLASLNETRDRMRLLSDQLAIALGDAGLSAAYEARKAEEKQTYVRMEAQDHIEMKEDEHQVKVEQLKRKHAAAEKEYHQKLEELAREIHAKPMHTAGRIYRAFPSFHSTAHETLWQEVQQKLHDIQYEN